MVSLTLLLIARLEELFSKVTTAKVVKACLIGVSSRVLFSQFEIIAKTVMISLYYECDFAIIA